MTWQPMSAEELARGREKARDSAMRAALLAYDLTPDEVRVITGLVRAMRESESSGIVSGRCEGYEGTARVHIGHAAYEIDMALAVDEPGALEAVRLRAAAWHIAHAISQMGES